MALHSPAVPPQEAQQSAAEDHDPLTAQAAAPTSTAVKPESFVNYQTAVSLPVASQPTVVLPSVHIGLEQPDAGTVPLGSHSPRVPQEEQTAGDAAKSDTSTPTAVDVVCADTQGVLRLDFGKMRCCIEYKGQDMSGTEFEKAAGREKAKKWKTSVRVAPVNGKHGEMIGDWLQRHGLDVRMSQLFKIGEARPAAAARAPAGPRPLTVSRPSVPKPPPPNSTAMLASAFESTILEHLDKQYIGLQQGDPDVTFDRLPSGEAMPEMEPGMKVLDLRTTSYQQLMNVSATSAPNPFGELLPFNPGVLPSRLGYMTGQQPKRQRLRETAPDPDKAKLLMGQYLSGSIPSPPWEAMGLARPPVIGGRELDLRRFHEAIEECGGFDAAVSNKKFGRIAVKLGIDLAVATNAAYLLKFHYQRLLAPYRQTAEELTSSQQPAALAHREQDRDAMQVDSESAEREASLPADMPDAHQGGDRAGLDDSTIQQHSAVITARLQSQTGQGGIPESDNEDADQTLSIPVDFKATLVDSSGPIPGLEDL